MSKEIKKALIDLMSIVVTDIHENEVRIDKTKIINEYNESVRTVLNYIKKIEDEIKKIYEGEIYTYKQLKNIEENQKKYFINKQAIRELKEKIHNTLDKNGITRIYQLEIDNYFDELLKEDV